MRRLLSTILLCGLTLCTSTGCSVTRPAYGRWEQFSSDNSLKLPDFELFYVGTRPDRHIRFGDTLRWSIIYNFEARKGEERVPLTWSPGTGLIVASPFEIGGRKYFLEMVKSDFLSEPAPEEAVAVWPEEDWESQRNPWWRLW